MGVNLLEPISLPYSGLQKLLLIALFYLICFWRNGAIDTLGCWDIAESLRFVSRTIITKLIHVKENYQTQVRQTHNRTFQQHSDRFGEGGNSFRNIAIWWRDQTKSCQKFRHMFTPTKSEQDKINHSNFATGFVRTRLWNQTVLRACTCRHQFCYVHHKNAHMSILL